ncbi:MAG TPA: AraC family transcriptional regulator [Thermotogota bacterium]|nr:AraC family transcriptional regulator [Thermotogota bacterium]HRW34893.1 AraC family transcriptional regulator [Thermotogota bacterium]
MNKEEQIRSVQKMQKYLKDHIQEELSLKKVAEQVNYSPWYAAKIFKEYTGKTIFEYLRALRLTKAALKLRDEKTRVIDVAFDFHFNSHEGFTRAFSKEFGISPKSYSKKAPPIKLFMPYLVEGLISLKRKGVNEMEKKEKLQTVFVQVVERDERRFIVRRGKKAKDSFEYCEEVPCEIWGILSSIKEAINEPMGVWFPKNMIKPGTSEYAQGVEVPADFSGSIPEGCEIMDLPKCKMMIFQGPPYEEEAFRTAIGELWQAIDDYNPELYGFEWAREDAPRFQLEPVGYRGYIEGRPVRLKKTKKD